MSVLLQVKDLRKRYGVTTVLENATAAFSLGQKIGVIGRNGAGKSTLCKIITGEEEADSGEVIKNRSLRLSYLEQHDAYGEEEIVVEFLMRYTGKAEWECGEIAAKFQIDYDQLHSSIAKLSGGFRTRIKLSAMLLKDPNFLILDEPTNYLDLSTLILLEHFLQSFRGGYLIVSHDREFLKRTCDQTLEVDQGGLSLYPGSIEDYFEYKEETLRQKIAYNKTVLKKKEQLQDFVDRFRAKASKATQAKSKMKQIEKLSTIEIAHTASTVNIRIPQVERKAGIAFDCENLRIGYPEKDVAGDIRLEVERGAKVAVLGDNGQGKTTFFKTIAQDIPKKGGVFKWGFGLKIAYYAQHVLSMLHPEDSVYTHLQREAVEGVSNQNLLDMAGCFLFSGDDVKKKVSVLSGGERARLCLAGLLLSKSHVLLLDEPTNHLDFETVEALGKALRSFSGTVFFISHDRTFVHLVASHILEVKDGHILNYPGTYEDYVYYLESRASGDSSPPIRRAQKKVKNDRDSKQKHSVQTNHPEKEKEGQRRRKVKAEIKKMKTKIEKNKKSVAHLLEERDELLEEIKKNPFNFKRQRNERIKQLTIFVEQNEDELKKLEKDLAKLQSEI